LTFGAWRTLASADTAVRHEYPLRADRVFLDPELTMFVRPRRLVTPAYPGALRTRRVTASVVAEYVVDTLGRVERESVRAVNAADPAFVAAVRAALVASEFEPGEVKGRPVRVQMRQVYQFSP
jgi:hypothetical protein